MKKITFQFNGSTRTVLADESHSLRQIMEEEDIVFAGRTVSVDGYCVLPNQFDRPLADLTDNEIVKIGVTSKSDNAAAATVTGNSLVVTSQLKLEDLKTVKKYRPNALRMFEKDEDGNKEEVFRLAISEEGIGKIDSFSATYGKTTNADGRALLTVLVDDAKPDFIKDKFGPALLKLKKLEDGLSAVLEEIVAEKAAVEEQIQFN